MTKYSLIAVVSLSTLTMSNVNAQIKKNLLPNYSLNGNIAQWPTSKIYMQYWVKDIKVMDSAVVTNGSFVLKGNIEDPCLAYFYANPKDYYPIRAFYIESSKMKVSGDFKKPYEWVITGSKAQNEGHILKEAHEPFKVKKDSLMSLKKQKDIPNLDAINKELSKVNKAYDSVTIAYIKRNPNSYLSLYNIPSLYAVMPLDDVFGLYNTLSPSIKKSYYGKTILEKMNNMKSVLVGNIAPDFELPDTAGHIVHLNDFKGKYVLVDFWASWCGPCRAENPNVKVAYNKYKNNNFTVLGISLDKPGAKMRWVQAILNDKLPWTQLSDLKEFSSPVAIRYGIDAIPTNFLIDPNGKIIAKNLRGEKLQDFLKNLFNI